MRFLRALADNSAKQSLASWFRKKRSKIFAALIVDLPKPLNILDLGGTEDFWIKTGLSDISGLNVTVANITQEKVTLPNFSAIKANACDLAEIRDGSFDIVFSNSVIEHVGSREAQAQMAREVHRVGRSYFVQTPAKYFPIEPHFLFPFFAVLPQFVKVWLVQHFALGWFPKQETREQALEFLKHFQLLTLSDMKALFPEATIVKERFLGITKSYVAYAGIETISQRRAA